MTISRADLRRTDLLGPPPRLSVVVPTFNEAENIPELFTQLARALCPRIPSEIIVVDDSTDATPHVVAALSAECPLPVILLHRDTAKGGLGGAVVEGLRLARAPWVVVMDGDLQHPPSVVPDLLAAGTDDVDVVVASRYSAGGSNVGLGNRWRVLISMLFTVTAKLVLGPSIRRISDPMSGFFAIRREAVTLEELHPDGYKILLELVVRGRITRVAEVPFRFQDRHAGTSKSSVREGLRFIRHLLVLRCRDARVRILAFGAIGVSGLLPNLAALWLLVTQLDLHYVPAAVAATQVAIVWNFLLVDRLLLHHRRVRPGHERFGAFLLLNNADLLLRIPMLAVLVESLHLGYLPATAITIAAAFAARFLITDRVIYGRRHDGRVEARRRRFSEEADHGMVGT